jgi:hypothetical protein|nr:MAG TPA: hypothetical protein [Caudoviricetes sp.]DAY96184.1 MAG TPA: hypothetical protein [Caudoviricetes sp.]
MNVGNRFDDILLGFSLGFSIASLIVVLVIQFGGAL